MAAALKGTSYDTGLEVSKIEAIGEHFAALIEKYRPPLARETAVQSSGLLSQQISTDALSTLARHLMEMKEDIRKLGFRSEEVIQMATKSAPAANPAAESPKEFSIELDGEIFDVKISSVAAKLAEVEKPKESVAISKGSVVTPMPGVVLSINVKVGDRVSEGELVATVEAMKMHYEVYTACSGIVKAVLCSEGDIVEAETVLIVVEPDDK
jgi:biotin carboxyl carrier protein